MTRKRRIRCQCCDEMHGTGDGNKDMDRCPVRAYNMPMASFARRVRRPESHWNRGIAAMRKQHVQRIVDVLKPLAIRRFDEAA